MHAKVRHLRKGSDAADFLVVAETMGGQGNEQNGNVCDEAVIANTGRASYCRFLKCYGGG